MRELPLILDVCRRHVQHDRDPVTDEHWDGAVCEVGSAVIEGDDDRITLGHPAAFEQLEGAIERRGPSLVGDERHLLLETRPREIDLDRCAPSDPVVLEQHDTAGWGHEPVGRGGGPFHRLQRQRTSVLPHRQLGALRRSLPARMQVAHHGDVVSLQRHRQLLVRQGDVQRKVEIQFAPHAAGLQQSFQSRIVA